MCERACKAALLMFTVPLPGWRGETASKRLMQQGWVLEVAAMVDERYSVCEKVTQGWTGSTRTRRELAGRIELFHTSETRQLTEDRGGGVLRSVAAVPEGISALCCLRLLRGRCT